MPRIMGPVMNAQAGERRSCGRPVIGISALTAVPVAWQGSEVTATLSAPAIVDPIVAAGCTPVLLPLLPGVEQAISRLDGLLLPGGADVDPALYGATAHPEAGRVSPANDAAELALLERALAAGLAILGICRGLQLLNIVRGGTLHQNLPEITGNRGHQPAPGIPGTPGSPFGPQRLKLRPGSHVTAMFGGETAEVPCHHHQAVDRLGAGLVATAWAADGVIEAVEAVDHPFAVGVQWHADAAGDERPFLALAEAARRASAGTAR
jgi:putative glutamine amidotransferase